MKITIEPPEPPEYIVCPKCETKMYIDYTRKRDPRIDGIYNITVRSPGYVGAGKTAGTYVEVNICNNCKTILGIGSSS